MHLLDLVLLVIVVGWAIAGAMSGFLPQLNTLLSIIIGALGAWLFSPMVAYKLEGLVQSPGVSIILAPVILFILIGLISKILLNLFFKVITTEEGSGGGWILGCAFGALKGLLLGGVIVYFLGQYGKPELIENSVSFKRYYVASEWTVNKFEEYGISENAAKAANYIRDNLLPPTDQREEAIESASDSFYNDTIENYFKNDFFKSASEFFSTGEEASE